MKRALVVAMILVAAGYLLLRALAAGWFGRHEEPGQVTRRPIPAEIVAERAAQQRSAAAAVSAVAGAGTETPADKQILFGDLHVHTTFSPDAYLRSLPMLQGEGAHPPADACDFARYCSALDFWSINDHAEGITPQHWKETVETIRQCNAVAGDAANPDVVAFLGWEWTQVGLTPDTHYGHKNVVLKGTGDDEIPARPIASRSVSQGALRGSVPPMQRALLALAGGERRYHDLLRYFEERASTDACPDDVPVRDLPVECMESAATPGELFAKLDDWGHESIVIPHGTTWGMYTPAGSTWDKQLSAAQHDPNRQTLIEVYSGHGNSEEYRDYEEVRFDATGQPRCPPPTKTHLPSCWRAGQIIHERCTEAGLDAKTCDERADVARQRYAEAGNAGHHVVPGVTIDDWLDSGQCRDCFLPSFNYRPGGSAQYILALRNFDEGAGPERFRFGFMASSDNHSARPGTGYKEINRREMTEASGAADPTWRARLAPPPTDPKPESSSAEDVFQRMQAFQVFEMERQASFFMTGGLIAAHAEGRGRDAVWQALQRREVYGTSGDRILLWFDLLEDDASGGGIVPMGGELETNQNPRFRVRAVGAFRQKPGCPEDSLVALGAERIERLCRGECYNPSDDRKRITRIEVVRIRPKARRTDRVADLIDDPWKVHSCPPDASGCTFEFEDPTFATSGRDTVYYVRAIEEPSPTVNAGNLRCTRDAEGSCIEVNPCYGDYRTDYQDDCLADSEERAWSSPIFVDWIAASGTISATSARKARGRA